MRINSIIGCPGRTGSVEADPAGAKKPAAHRDAPRAASNYNSMASTSTTNRRGIAEECRDDREHGIADPADVQDVGSLRRLRRAEGLLVHRTPATNVSWRKNSVGSNSAFVVSR